MTQILRSLDEAPRAFGPSVVTAGNFDGVHCGHQAVIANVISTARRLAAKSVVVTFTPHTSQVVSPERAPKLLTPEDVKLELLEQTGVDAVLLLPFTHQLRHTSPRDFADRVFRQALGAVEVHEGDNFQFGYRAQGSVSRLQEIGNELGFRTVVEPPTLYRGKPISSSRVRECLQAGRLSEARHLLGRNFSIRGTPAKGRGYGSRYAVPTINLAEYAGLLPGNGVYIAELEIAGERFQSLTNIGNRPTFGAGPFAVEAHILDFHPIALDEHTRLELTFLSRLRDEKKFGSPGALKQQIGRDVARARRWFSLRSSLVRAEP